MFAFHAHRELLYALAELLELPLSVDRPGVQKGLIHPSTGVFFELWRDPKAASKSLKKCVAESTLPALNANRGNKRAYEANAVDDAYLVRVLLWVPCWDDNGRSNTLDKQGDCGARVAVIKECGEEFCSYRKFKEVIRSALERGGGDFKSLCRAPEPEAKSPTLQYPQYAEEANNWVKVAAGV
jgi:hypothetical protein